MTQEGSDRVGGGGGGGDVGNTWESKVWCKRDDAIRKNLDSNRKKNNNKNKVILIGGREKLLDDTWVR